MDSLFNKFNKFSKESFFKRFLKSAFIDKARKNINDSNYVSKVKEKALKLGEKGKEITDAVQNLISVLSRKDISIFPKILGVAALIYLITPIDFIPDFLIFGYIDDIIILVSTVSMIIQSVSSVKDKKDDINKESSISTKNKDKKENKKINLNKIMEKVNKNNKNKENKKNNSIWQSIKEKFI